MSLTTLPSASGPGAKITCTVADTDYSIPIPGKATGAVIWFTSGANMVAGRYAWEANTTAITVTDTSMAYVPPEPTTIEKRYSTLVKHLHVASSTAGAVAVITWMTESS